MKPDHEHRFFGNDAHFICGSVHEAGAFLAAGTLFFGAGTESEHLLYRIDGDQLRRTAVCCKNEVGIVIHTEYDVFGFFL